MQLPYSYLLTLCLSLLFAAPAGAEPRRIAVLGFQDYQAGYASRLEAQGIAFDKLDGPALLEKTLEELLDYQAVFVSLGIDRVGISRAYAESLTHYVESGGVLVLEQKAQIKLPPVTVASRLSTKQFAITAEAKPWFDGLSPDQPLAYNGGLFTLAPDPSLTVLATSDGQPVMGFGTHGRGRILYSGASSGYIAKTSPNSLYTPLVDVDQNDGGRFQKLLGVRGETWVGGKHTTNVGDEAGLIPKASADIASS